MAEQHEIANAPPRRALLLTVLLALFAWLPSIFLAGFSHDDREAVFENPVVTKELPLHAAFERDYWHHRGDAGHYRPLATVSLRFDAALWGNASAGYHATNVLLHAATVLLLGLWFIRLNRSPLPWLGLALFATHPVLADSVAWLSGRTSMISALGGLLGALFLSRSRSATTAASAAGCGLLLALLGKEDGLVFGLAYFVTAKSHRRAVALGCLFGLFAYLALRAHALGSPFPSAPGAPLANTPFLERMRVGGLGILEGLRLLALPFAYPPHYRVQDLALGTQPDSIGASIAAACAWSALLAVLLAPFLRSRSKSVRIWGALAAAAWLPVSQLIPAGEVLAPRFLYPVLLFGVPLVDALLRRALPSGHMRAVLCVLALAIVLPTAWQRSNVYESRGSYREAILALHPDDARSWNGLGHDFFERGRVAEAREAWGRAIALEPNYSRPYTNLGISFFAGGETSTALEYFEQAVRTGPRNPIAHTWLGRTYCELGRYTAAREQFEIATRFAPGLVEAWNGLAEARLELGEFEAARSALEQSKTLAPRNPKARQLTERLRAAEH